MPYRAQVAGDEATFEEFRWAHSSARITDLLNTLTDFVEPEGDYYPDWERHVFRTVVEQIHGSIVEEAPPMKTQPGRVH